MAVSLKGGNEVRQEGNQAFRADIVGGSPRGRKRRRDCRTIASGTWPADRRRCSDHALPSQTNGVLSVVARHGDELVKDLAFRRQRRRPIARRDVEQQRASGLKSHPTPHLFLPSLVFSLQCRVTSLVRQNCPKSYIFRESMRPLQSYIKGTHHIGHAGVHVHPIGFQPCVSKRRGRRL